jgi:hypothetical protein
MYIRVKRQKTTVFLQVEPTDTVLEVKQKLQGLLDKVSDAVNAMDDISLPVHNYWQHCAVPPRTILTGHLYHLYPWSSAAAVCCFCSSDVTLNHHVLQPPEHIRLYKLPKEGDAETGPKTLLEDAQKLADAKVENEDRLALCYQLEGAIFLSN